MVEKTSSSPQTENSKSLPKQTQFSNSRSQLYLQSSNSIDSSLNLENVLLVEDKLWSLLELHRYLEQTQTSFELKIQEAALLCDEWWEVTHTDNINNLDRVFLKQDDLRRAVRHALISMLLTVTCIYAYSIEKCGQNTSIETRVITKAKKMLFFTHQNFLTLIQLIISRLPSVSKENLWAHSLQAIILNKVAMSSQPALLIGLQKQKKTQLLDVNQLTQSLQTNTAKALKIAESLAKNSPANAGLKTQLNIPIFKCIVALSVNFNKHSVPQVRNLLFQLLEALTVKKNSQIQLKQQVDEKVTKTQEQPPFLPPSTKTFTLVLDLDETLIHYIDVGEGQFLIRPGSREFLEKMSTLYEVVIFTAATQDYADWVINQLDTGNWIKHRLYRQHTRKEGQVYIKDLSLLGRPLAQSVIVDNVAQNFQRQPQNGIEIRSWYDDADDTALFELTPILYSIAQHQSGDLRIALSTYEQ